MPMPKDGPADVAGAETDSSGSKAQEKIGSSHEPYAHADLTLPTYEPTHSVVQDEPWAKGNEQFQGLVEGTCAGWRDEQLLGAQAVGIGLSQTPKVQVDEIVPE